MKSNKLLKTVNILRNGGDIDGLVEKYALDMTRHETEPLIILNYGIIEARKGEDVHNECRSLCLETGSFKVVARSFIRFFNWGEMASAQGLFKSDDFWAVSKEDGSIFTLYHYNGSWRVNTRKTFSDGKLQPLGMQTEMSWGDLFWLALDKQGWNREKVESELNKSYSYVFEICSLYNKVVRTYSEPEAFLIAVVKNNESRTPEELSEEEMDQIGLARPVRYKMHGIDDALSFVKSLNCMPSVSEGVVIRDRNNMRWKMKTLSYLTLHRCMANKVPTPKLLIPLLLTEEMSEVLAYFPEFKSYADELQAFLDEKKADLQALWLQSKHISDQKEFALTIAHNKLKAILFTTRKLGLDSIDKVWSESGEYILKVFF